MEISTNSYAGFWLRFIAFAIDYVVIQIFQAIVLIPLITALGYQFETIPEEELMELAQAEPYIALNAMIGTMGALLLVNLGATILYYSLMESSKYKATLGKLALGLEVTDLNGVPLSFGLALLRNVGKLFSTIFFMVGYILAGLSAKKQALHDMLANTLVVRK